MGVKLKDFIKSLQEFQHDNSHGDGEIDIEIICTDNDDEVFDYELDTSDNYHQGFELSQNGGCGCVMAVRLRIRKKINDA